MPNNLHPDFPVVTGDYLLTKGWRVQLPEQFNRRVEDGSLVLWMPALTFWINAWNNDEPAGIEEQLTAIMKLANSERRDEQIERSDRLVHVTYELAEDDPEQDDGQCHSISAYVIAPSGYVQIAAYYDSPEARALGYRIIRSVCSDT